MANPAAHDLGGSLLQRWSPAIFWCSVTAVILTALQAQDLATLEATLTSAPILAALIIVVLPSLVGLLLQRRAHFKLLQITEKPLARLAADASTVAGAGLTPKGSGTIGAVAALPAGWLLAQLDTPLRAAILAALTALTTYASARYLTHAAAAAGAAGKTAHLDPSEVVVDEYVGVLLALAFVPWNLPWATAAFLLFRAFDIIKPGPVGWADRQLPGAWGVMFDDVIAGLMAGVLLALARLALGAYGAPS